MLLGSNRIRIGMAAIAAAALAGGGLALSPASASTSASASAKAPSGESITLFLRAPNMKGLDKLAAATNVTHAQRIKRIKSLIPSDATHAAVVKALAAHGFTTTGQTAWTVTAVGKPSLVTTLFGTRPLLPKTNITPSDIAAAAGPLSKLPSFISRYANTVMPTFGGADNIRPLATTELNGNDFRNAYTSMNVSPYSGKDANGYLTVATLQFTTWNPSDLTTYAKDNGFSDPVADKQYVGVNVNGGPTSDAGSVETDLDQESILDTDPYAHQQAYFANYSDANYMAEISAVLDDVTDDSHATAPNPTIAALSTSWGDCESAWGGTDIKDTETAIKALVAAGVTMFDAAGDAGIYDCGTPTIPTLPIIGNLPGVGPEPDVEFPSTSPQVVSVGGTNLGYSGSGTTSVANNGSNWTETGWTCTDELSCYENPVDSTGGGGGGESGEDYANESGTNPPPFKGFAKPSYQKKYVTDAPFAAAKNRLIPDIAADADPQTGFNIYASNGCTNANSSCEIGGTSLASPISAALLVNTLSHYGLTAGVGDIHNGLYRAAIDDPKAFRDIVTGTNGASGDLAGETNADPSVSAQQGYDTVGGLGAPLWPELASFIIHGSPKLGDSLRLSTPNSRTAYTQVKAAWAAGQAANGMPPTHTSVLIEEFGVTKPVYSETSGPVTGEYSFIGVPGESYAMLVTAYAPGAKKTEVAQAMYVPYDDRAFSYHDSGWQYENNKACYGGGIHVTHRVGAYATFRATGREFGIYVTTGPSAGKLIAYVDGKKVRTINEYSKRIGHRAFLLLDASKRSTHNFKLVAFGPAKKGRKARSAKVVDLDGMDVTYS